MANYYLLKEDGFKILQENGGGILLEAIYPVVFINGVEKTSLIDWMSFQKTEVLTKDPDTLVIMFKNYPTKTYQPALNDLIVVNYNGVRIFGGYVISSDETVDGLLKYYTVTAKDYSSILDRMIVSKVYTNMLAQDIVTDLLNTFCSGLTTGIISANVNIALLKFNYISVRECLKKIINIIGNYDYYVDYFAKLYFLPVGITPAPFSITDTSQNYNWNSLDVTADLSQLTNVIIVRGATRVGATLMTEYNSGDGTTYTFPLAYNFSAIPTVTVGGVAQTVGNDGVDKEASFQCMWNPTSQAIRFTAGNIPIAGTRNIIATGYPLYPLLVQKSDSNSIATYGEWQKVIIDKNLQDQVTASQRADAELLANSQPIYTLNFTTYVDGLVKGQLLSFSSAKRNLSLSLKIQEIVTTIRTPVKSMSYTIKAISAPPVGINEVLNQLLVKDPANQIDINTTELIERYYNFNETLTVSDSIGAPTFTSGPYNWNGATSIWGFFTWS